MENRREVTFVPGGRVRLVLQGEPEKVVEAPGRTPLVVRWLDGTPADRRFRVKVTEVAWADKDGIAAERATWEARGFQVRLEQLGQVYGIVGKILDNRKALVLLEPAFTAPEAAARQAELVRSWGARTTLAEEVQTAASIRLRLDMADGTPLGTSEGPIVAETPGGEGFEVRSVEFAVGYPNHGFETREYRGALSFAADASGTIAVVNLVSLEDLLSGLVPSEIFSARTRRGAEGTGRHRAGRGAGEGGHPSIWPTPTCSAPSSTARCTGAAPGRRRRPTPRWRRREASRSSPPRDAWWTRSTARCAAATPRTTTPSGAACPTRACAAGPTCSSRWRGCPTRDARRTASWPSIFRQPAGGGASPSRRSTAGRSGSLRSSWVRWSNPLKVGSVVHLQPLERGASGRVRLLPVSGTRGATQLRGELNIRRLFGMLNSALFTVSEERDARGNPVAFVFRGGGLGPRRGHVSDGAIGRAESRTGLQGDPPALFQWGRGRAHLRVATDLGAVARGRTPGTRGGTGVPFRSYVGPAREPVRTHPSPPPPPSGSDRDPRHAPGAAVPRQRARALLLLNFVSVKWPGGDRIRPKPQAVTLRNIDPRAWAKNRATAREQERPEPQRRAEAAKKPEPKDDKNPKGQVVDVAPGNEQESPDAKFLAEKNNRVDKESKAKDQTPFYRNAMPRQTATEERNTTGKDSASQIVVQGNGGTGQDKRPAQKGGGQRPVFDVPTLKQRDQIALQGADQQGPRGERQEPGRERAIAGQLRPAPRRSRPSGRGG